MELVCKCTDTGRTELLDISAEDTVRRLREAVSELFAFERGASFDIVLSDGVMLDEPAHPIEQCNLQSGDELSVRLNPDLFSPFEIARDTRVASLAVSPCGTRMYSVDGDHIRSWNALNGENLHWQRCPHNRLCVSSCGAYISVWTADSDQFCVFSDTLIPTPHGEGVSSGPIRSLLCEAGMLIVLSANRCQVYNLPTLTCSKRIDSLAAVDPTQCLMSSCGTTLFIIGKGGIKAVRTADWVEAYSVVGSFAMMSLAGSGELAYTVTHSRPCIVQRWRVGVDGFHEEARREVPFRALRGFAVSACGSWIFCAQNVMCILDAATLKCASRKSLGKYLAFAVPPQATGLWSGGKVACVTANQLYIHSAEEMARLHPPPRSGVSAVSAAATTGCKRTRRGCVIA